MLKSATGEGNFLGVYVNRSMVVGSTLNQLNDFMDEIAGISGAADSPEVKKLLQYRIGMLGQETAIDLAIGSGERTLKIKGLAGDMSAIASAIEGRTITNAAAAEKAVLKAMGYTADEIAERSNTRYCWFKSYTKLRKIYRWYSSTI